MNRTYSFMSTLMAFIMGWIMGGPSYGHPESSYYHLAICVSVILILRAWVWLDSVRSKRIQTHWLSIRSMGKTGFIIVYNVLLRGIALALVFFLVPFVVFGFTASALRILAAAAVFLIAALTYLGHKEWQLNELTPPGKNTIAGMNEK